MLRRFLFFLCFCSTEALADLDVDLFTRAESFSSSDAAILKSYLNKLIGPKPNKGRYVLTRNNLEFGMAWDASEFSFFHRNDYNLGFDPETLDFAYKNNNKVPIPLDQNYQVSVVANQYQLTGFKLGHEFRLTETVRFWAAGSYLHATEAVSGYLGKAEDGSGGTVSKSRIQLPFNSGYRIDLKGNLHTDYFFTSDPLFGRNVDPPTGEGYSLDLGLSWQLRSDLLLQLKISDALAKIYWEGLAHTVADATSDRFVEDEDGVWQANPSYNGLGVEESFRQDLTRRVQLSGRYGWRDYQFIYEYDDMGLASFHRAKVAYQFNQDWGVQGSLDLQRTTLGLTLLAPFGDLHFMFDEFALGNSRNIGFGWYLKLSL